ncbi:hypothetical protein F5879DRAFT_922647 [Lentinula edodes]|nr:hypothetical protein F5879DRAFT_922647 [Lentinula edodes]
MTDSESEVTSHLLDDFDNASDQFLESDSAPVASGSHHVPNTTSNNRTGKNQHQESARIGDKKVYTALLEYHQRNITNKDTISQLLKTDYGINLSRATAQSMPDLDKRQLVFDEMAKDPKRGPRTIKECLSMEHGVHLTREFIEDTMQEEDSEGFRLRDPTSEKIPRTNGVEMGMINWRQSDFQFGGVRDVWSGKWLGLWVVPNNRLKDTIGIYLRETESVHYNDGMLVETVEEKPLVSFQHFVQFSPSVIPVNTSKHPGQEGITTRAENGPQETMVFGTLLYISCGQRHPNLNQLTLEDTEEGRKECRGLS